MDRKKKLLQINTVVNYGSTGRIAEQIGQIAMENEWDSFIAFGRNEKSSKSNLIRIGDNLDVRLHGIQTRLFDRHGLGSRYATKRLVEQIETVEPDVIHLHNIHGYYLNIEILFNYLSRLETPVIWTLHDCWPLTGHCVYFDYIGCNKWKTECNNCPQKLSYPSSIFMDRSKRNYRLKKSLFTSLKNLTIVPVSDWLADIVTQSFLSNAKIKVINNGIDTSLFCPVDSDNLRKKNGLQGKFVILGVANIWSSRKGFEDFIKISKKVTSDCQIILIGLNSEQIKRLPTNIIGLERTESVDELGEYYSCADVFINTTLEDNFPTTNLEALACGTPVITYRTGGSPESVTKETGFIVEKGDIEGLINAIAFIKSVTKNSYRKACTERATNLYNKEYSFMNYIRLYESSLVK